MILLREASIHDIPEIQEVAISTYKDTFAQFNTMANLQAYFKQAYHVQTLTDELFERKARMMVACDDSGIVGFVRLRETEEVQDRLGDNTIELQRLYVLTQAQGKSIGKMLMENSLAYAMERNYEWIWLGVWERNHKAQEFYKRFGFEKFSEHTFWQGDEPQIDWLLKRKL